MHLHAHTERFLRTLKVVYGSLFAAIGLTVVIFGPIERPIEVLLLALEFGALGIVIGYELGSRRRQFLPLHDSGPRRSQSIRRVEKQIVYESSDLLEQRFTLQPVYVSGILNRAVQSAPFFSSPVHYQTNQKLGRWVFHTEDSHGLPVFMDELGILAMGQFCAGQMREEPIQPLLQRIYELRLLIRPSGIEG